MNRYQNPPSPLQVITKETADAVQSQMTRIKQISGAPYKAHQPWEDEEKRSGRERGRKKTEVHKGDTGIQSPRQKEQVLLGSQCEIKAIGEGLQRGERIRPGQHMQDFLGKV